MLAVSSAALSSARSLGNDVNLRDLEGRSRAPARQGEGQQRQCAIGPFIRLFDQHFSLDDVARADVRLTVDGEDGYHARGASAMHKISRVPQNSSRRHRRAPPVS